MRLKVETLPEEVAPSEADWNEFDEWFRGFKDAEDAYWALAVKVCAAPSDLVKRRLLKALYLLGLSEA